MTISQQNRLNLHETSGCKYKNRKGGSSKPNNKRNNDMTLTTSNKFNVLINEDEHQENESYKQNKQYEGSGQRANEYREVRKGENIIIDASMTKHLDSRRIGKSIKGKGPRIHVETFKGTKTEAMMHYVKPCLRKNVDKLILHVGTNDIKSKTTKQIADNIVDIYQSVDMNHSKTQIIISEII